MDEQWRAEPASDLSGLAGALGRVAADTHVQRPTRADRVIERGNGLLEWGLRIEAMRVEDVYIIETEAAQRLIQRGEHVLASTTARSVGSGPHVISGLGRDHQFIPVGGQIRAQQLAEVDLRLAGRRPVVVCEVEVRDAGIEGGAHDLALGSGRMKVAEVLPQPQRDGWQQKSRASAAAIDH
ncbi:hypothetical protein SDC9_115598 [bioreactor metagenome]|uniref:Uncharacterized protein n=1 Tax=bioreactor metagenome TaxID=1076179 RepID=A0A645C3X7_9ZZZZ